LIFKHLADKGKTLGVPPVAITFHPHPRVIVTPEDPPLLLTTTEEKIEILNDHFDGSLVLLNFDDELRKMTAEKFVKDILLDELGIKALVVGYNHSLGRDRSGNIDKLQVIGAREGFEIEVADSVTFHDMPISSSRIRRAIQNGEWSKASSMLGHPYPIRGPVIKGLGYGKKMGWPTVNLKWSERKLLPREGVYSCSASVNGSMYKGMMFIGVNMLSAEKTVSVEANLFDFGRDVYDMEVTLYPTHFIRENARFNSPAELSRQIARDKEEILKLIS
jgi:riboflavin kinase/FMN adenylyltransferase